MQQLIAASLPSLSLVVVAGVGPFLGTGGYDWHDVFVDRMPKNPKAKFITAKMFAPVGRDGEILSYPPVHAHHVHYSLDHVQVSETPPPPSRARHTCPFPPSLTFALLTWRTFKKNASPQNKK